MAKYDNNLTRALAILMTQPDEDDISFGAGRVFVAGQKLILQDEDDMQVLAILMADKEFGFAVTGIETAANQLREMQNVWWIEAKILQKEAAA